MLSNSNRIVRRINIHPILVQVLDMIRFLTEKKFRKKVIKMVTLYMLHKHQSRTLKIIFFDFIFNN